MTTHAILGASSAARWLACPGSVREIGALPIYLQNPGTKYAQEGTAAHALGEVCLRDDTEPEFYRGQWINADVAVFGSEEDAKTLPGDWFPVNSDMIDAVSIYTDAIRGYMAKFGNAQLHLEKKVYPVVGREDDLFGTADAIVVEPYGVLIVGDYKHGAGIVVEIEDNDQLKYYGLGALNYVEGMGEEVSEVWLVIIQPRAEHRDGPVRRWKISVEDLREFGDTLVAGSAATEDPLAQLVSGSHCRDHFCNAQAKCPLLKSQIMETAMEILPDIEEPVVRLPDSSDGAEIARAMTIASLAKGWAKSVGEMAIIAAQAGVEIPGKKMVRKSKNRAWKDADDVERRLKNKKGILASKIFKTVLQTPAQVEKVVGKEWVAKYAHKPEGDVILVDEDDKRLALPPLAESLPQIDAPAEDDNDLL